MADYYDRSGRVPPEPGPQQVVNVGSEPAGSYGWRSSIPNIASPVGAILLIVTGALVMISTFLSWVGPFTGWGLMYSGSVSGRTSNFLFTIVNPGIVFSGFWALLFGFLIILGGVMLLLRLNGSSLAMISAFLGLVIAVVNIVFIYINSSGFPSGPGAGLWMFAIVCLIGILLGATVVPSEFYYAE